MHGLRRTRILLLGLLPGFLWANHVRAENAKDYPPPPYHDYEKICREVEGTYQIMECLLDHLSKAERSLQKVVSMLLLSRQDESGLSPEDRARHERDADNLKAAQEAWETERSRTCDQMLFEYWLPGSLSKTEPVRCSYLMTRERERLLRIIFYREIRYMETEGVDGD